MGVWISHVRFLQNILHPLVMYARPITSHWCLELAHPLTSSRKKDKKGVSQTNSVQDTNPGTRALHDKSQAAEQPLQNLAITVPQGKLTDGDVSEVLVVQQAVLFCHSRANLVGAWITGKVKGNHLRHISTLPVLVCSQGWAHRRWPFRLFPQRECSPFLPVRASMQSMPGRRPMKSPTKSFPTIPATHPKTSTTVAWSSAISLASRLLCTQLGEVMGHREGKREKALGFESACFCLLSTCLPFIMFPHAICTPTTRISHWIIYILFLIFMVRSRNTRNKCVLFLYVVSLSELSSIKEAMN